MKLDQQLSRLRAALRNDFPDIGQGPGPEDELDQPPERSVEDRITLDRSSLRPALFDYQEDLARQISRLDAPAALLGLPTGAGKTRTAVVAVLDSIGSGRFSRVVWLAPTTELIDQAWDTFDSMWLVHGAVDRLTLTRKLHSDSSSPCVTLVTPQAIYANRRNLPDTPCDLVVFDEAHQLGARSFRLATEALIGEPPKGGSLLLGLSATPGRVDPGETEDLVELFGGRLLKSQGLAPNPVEVLQRRGILARLNFRRLTSSPIAVAAEPRRLKVGAKACIHLVDSGRKPLVFTASVAGAVVLAEALRSVGCQAQAVHSDLSRAQRLRVIQRFASGEVDVLINQRLLATGYDCPSVTDVVMLSRIGSPILFEQVVGRAARGPRTGGSSVATIWDFDDHLAIHGLPKSYYRYRDYDWTSR